MAKYGHIRGEIQEREKKGGRGGEGESPNLKFTFYNIDHHRLS